MFRCRFRWFKAVCQEKLLATYNERARMRGTLVLFLVKSISSQNRLRPATWLSDVLALYFPYRSDRMIGAKNDTRRFLCSLLLFITI